MKSCRHTGVWDFTVLYFNLYLSSSTVKTIIYIKKNHNVWIRNPHNRNFTKAIVLFVSGSNNMTVKQEWQLWKLFSVDHTHTHTHTNGQMRKITDASSWWCQITTCEGLPLKSTQCHDATKVKVVVHSVISGETVSLNSGTTNKPKPPKFKECAKYQWQIQTHINRKVCLHKMWFASAQQMDLKVFYGFRNNRGRRLSKSSPM